MAFMLGLCAMRAHEEKAGVGGDAGLQTVWVWRLIAGRLLVAGLLFGVSVLWTSALALRFTRIPLRAQAAAQFAIDALLVTWLVWVTGNLYSPYTALYILVISAASVFLGARGALVMAVGCAALYTAAMLGLTAGWFGGGGGRGLTAASLAEVAQATGLNVVAFLVVGLLAA